MRRLLRRRPETTPADTTVATIPVDPNVDPPIVAALLQPLLELRASLGSGVATPDESVVSALSSASTQVADTEGAHRDGLHALESTWTSKGADNAVPALRTTRTQIGDIADRGPEYLAVLGDAQSTSARAARSVDQIIADFRRDARQIMGTASTSSDADAVIARATLALRDAVTTVTAARSEMDDHTRRLDGMGPLTVTTPQGVLPTTQTTPGQVVPQGQVLPQGQVAPGTTTTPGVAATPLDPVQAAQLQLQQLLINAGVQVGTAGIQAGVDIGIHLIDKIAEVGTHAMDTVAASADKAIDKAIPELINPGSTANNNTTTTGVGNSGTAGKPVIDFGGGSGDSSKPSSGIGSGSPAQNGSASTTKPAPTPAPSTPPFATSDPPPSRPAAPDPAPHPGTTGGMALPPPLGSGDQEHKPREGQLGVTVPSQVVTATAAVIGDYGDDDDFGDDTL